MAERVRVGVVGSGIISGIYLRNCGKFDNLEVVAVADRHLDRAEARARRYGVPRFCSVADLLADPAVEIVLNLTSPASHGAIALAALEQGKSVYNEKPLAVTRADGQRILETAAQRDLLVGVAPDTFLGGGLQACRALIDEGAIGQPVAASAFVFHQPPETWHPSPAFFYEVGAGPLFDVGPYYLTTLAALLGPVQRVTGSAKMTYPERRITSQPRAGEMIPVHTPTHIAGILDFANDAVATLVTSFDVWGGEVPHIEIYGSEGTLSLPDPNTFGGPVRLRAAGAGAWSTVPVRPEFTRNSRGVGLADMADALRTGRAPRASGALGYHVLDVMHAILESAEQGRRLEVTSGVPRPEPLPPHAAGARFTDAAYAGRLSVDSPIGALLDDDRARAVLDRHVPGFTSGPRLAAMRDRPLIEMADYDPRTFTDEILAALTDDLPGGA